MGAGSDGYNGLVQSGPEIARLAQELKIIWTGSKYYLRGVSYGHYEL